MRLKKSWVAVLAAAAVTPLITLSTNAFGDQSKLAFTVEVSPTTQSIQAGQSATYAVKVKSRDGFKGTVTLSATGVPSGLTASFAPPSVLVNGTAATTLTVDVTQTMPVDSYAFTIKGISGTKTATTPVGVTVKPALLPLQISQVPVTGLLPGMTVPLNLSFFNPTTKTLKLTSLTVSLSGLVTPNSAAGPCSLALDYTLRQYSGPAVTVKPLKTVNVSSVTSNQSKWPAVGLIDSPTRIQNGCLGASVQLDYVGTVKPVDGDGG